MNRTLALLAIVLLTVACGKKNNYTITGKIEGGAGKTIYLSQLLTTTQVPADSVKMDQNGQFKLKGKVSEPTFFLMKLSDSNFVTLLLDSTENVTVTGTYNRFASDYTVTGSDNSSKVRELTFRFNAAKSKADSLSKLYQKHQNEAGYTADLERWNSEYIKQISDYTTYLNDFIKRNPFSMASVYALYQKWGENNYVANDFQAMKTAASALYAVYPKSDQVKALYNNTLTIIKEQKNADLNTLMSQKAVNSPNIKLPDASGIDRELWSLHGKYVLLHFWSAKDRTSRIQNQVLVELYAKYRNKGFEIYMVSVDDDRTAWKAAIEEDQLTWINVGDMKGSVSALMSYNIHTIPSNYLLDKAGTILAKNLKGPELNAALSKVL
ncbi:MAG TPA: TlpA disulfide reductase family protein [Prolixibacteraceae bacterium]|nr:TlpA disulfide reductase family protein [Prolixibacteraceae bacterium]